jgi:hypothetical protein
VESQVGPTQHKLIKTKSDGQDLTQSLKSAQTKIQRHSASVKRMQGDHALHLSTLENHIITQSEKLNWSSTHAAQVDISQEGRVRSPWVAEAVAV